MSLAPGVYGWTQQGATGHSMVSLRPGITLRGEAGAEATVLDAEQRGRVVLCFDVGSEVVLEALTIQRGVATGWAEYLFDNGGGVLSAGNSSPIIRRCVIKDNTAPLYGHGAGLACDTATIIECGVLGNTCLDSGRGGGISCGATTILRTLIRNNPSLGHTATGGGIAAYGANIRECRIEGNRAEGLFGSAGGGIEELGVIGTPTSIDQCVFIGNVARAVIEGTARGAALHAWRHCIVQGSVFVGNEAYGAGGFAGLGTISSSGPAVVTVTRCTIIGNQASGTETAVAGLFLDGGPVENCIIAWNRGAACRGDAILRCNDLYWNTNDAICGFDGGMNFSTDPAFCAVDPIGSLNVTLQSDSPCAGLTSGDGPGVCGVVGAAEVGCGKVSVRLQSWSDIKRRYRR